MAGLQQVYRHVGRGLHPGRDALQPPHIPRQALPGPAQPHHGCARLPQPGGPSVHPQRQGETWSQVVCLIK